MTASTSLLSLRRYVEDTYGQGSFKAIRDALHDKHAITLPPVLAPAAWYPTTWFLRGMDEARARFGSDDFYERFGAAAAEYEIHWVFRFALRFTSPLWLVERGAKEWCRAHDTGRWEVSAVGDHGLRGTLYEFGIVHEGQCRSLTSWFTRACQMTGERRARVEHPICRARGAKLCVFQGEW
jgi:hypothetical protein